MYDFDFVPHINERTCALAHLHVLQSEDIVIFDRGYFSYLLLHEFYKSGVHVIFRLQEGTVNKQIELFMRSSQTDQIIDYIPSGAVISDLKKQGYFLKPKPIPLRLIKYERNGSIYLCGTTLNQEEYSIADIAALYHERWSIEELYKISKNSIDSEKFHAKSEWGVKQEIYAHLVLINLSRFFEFDANNKLPLMGQEDKEVCNRFDFSKFFNSVSMFNINFKHYLTIVGRYIENLIIDVYEKIQQWLPNVLQMIVRVRQKIRPGRHYPRISHQPERKWGNKGKISSASP